MTVSRSLVDRRMASAATVIEGRHLDYHWNGARVDLYRDAGSGDVFRITWPTSMGARILRSTICGLSHVVTKMAQMGTQETSNRGWPRLTNGDTLDFEISHLEAKSRKFDWCRLQESNPRPSVYKTAALPTELNRHACPMRQTTPKVQPSVRARQAVSPAGCQSVARPALARSHAAARIASAA